MLAIREYRNFRQSRAVARFLGQLFARRALISDARWVHWTTFAQSLPRALFVVWLANEVVSALAIAQVGSAELQYEAECFLEQQFGPFRSERVILVFRHLIQHRLLKLAK